MPRRRAGVGSVRPNAPASRAAKGMCILRCFSYYAKDVVPRTLSIWFRDYLRSAAIEQAKGARIRPPRARCGCFGNTLLFYSSPSLALPFSGSSYLSLSLSGLVRPCTFAEAGNVIHTIASCGRRLPATRQYAFFQH